MMERRQFIQACIVMLGGSALAAGCGSGGGTDGDTTATAGNDLATGYARNTWATLPSLVFSVEHVTYGVIDMTMTDIEDDFYSPETEQFSVMLTGPETPLFAEGLYAMYNASLGNLQLYLQPSESPAGVQKYRAVFSLLA